MFQRSHLLGGVLLEGDDVAVAVVAPDAVSEDAVARTVASSPAAAAGNIAAGTGIPVIVADDSDNAGGRHDFSVGGFDVVQAEGPQFTCPVNRDDPLKC